MNHKDVFMPKPNVREEIVKSAFDHFHRMGFHDTSIDDITKNAKVPKGSFYNHFKNKEALASEVLDRYVQGGPHDHLLKKEIAPLKRLKQYFGMLEKDFVKSGFSKGCMLGNFSGELADHSGPIRAKLNLYFTNWTELIAGVVKEAQDVGEIESKQKPELIAGFLLSVWEGTLLRARAAKSDSALKEFNQVGFNQLLK